MTKAAICIWNNVADGRHADYDEWYLAEHFPQRLGHPGFRTGRRYVADSGTHRYFTLYEIDSIETGSSGAYLDSMNSPSAWSQKMMPALIDMTRCVCRVAFSAGYGIGGALACVQVRQNAQDAASGLQRIIDEDLNSLTKLPSVAQIKLLETDGDATNVNTSEKKLRKKTDDQVTWILLVETGTTEAALLLAQQLQQSITLKVSGIEEVKISTYRLTYHRRGEA
ncbi:MAG TPA: hypothetical protein VGO51_12260 [Burkholderiaceae bacterium]|jgi:hypothetical protein|nr:hypothetical protein [Burkholderiaceae bacterium]